MATTVGVVLSGNGVFDGTEIHEAVSILIALAREGVSVRCMAPDIPQMHVVNHLDQTEMQPARNVLTESARIARGSVSDIAQVQATELDALVFPGGFGAAKNLCGFASDGPECTVNPDVARLIRDCHAAGKPMGFACISPVIAARVLGEAGKQPKLTIGTDAGTAQAIGAMGAEHQNTEPTGICIDEANRIVSTACYMNDVTPDVVFDGASNMVQAVLKMTG